MEAGGAYLNERNPNVFGLADGSQLWNQVKVVDVYKDKMYEGIHDLENFSVTQTADKRDLIITGIGLKVTSRSGSVYNGIDGSNLSVLDVREYREQNSKGYREISLGVERVGGFGESGERFTGSIDLSTACVAWTDKNKNGMLIFTGIELTRTGGKSQFHIVGDEKFIGLEGCKFFQWFGDQDIYLHKLGVGPGRRGNLFVLGNKTGVFDLGGKTGTGKAHGVALIGVVGDVIRFIQNNPKIVTGEVFKMSECVYAKDKREMKRNCGKNIDKHLKNNEGAGQEWQLTMGYSQGYKWLRDNKNAWHGEFERWLLGSAKKRGWFPDGVKQHQVSSMIQDKTHSAIKLWKGPTENGTIGVGIWNSIKETGGLGKHQKWKKTAVMKNEEIKELEKGL